MKIDSRIAQFDSVRLNNNSSLNNDNSLADVQDRVNLSSSMSGHSDINEVKKEMVHNLNDDATSKKLLALQERINTGTYNVSAADIAIALMRT